MNEVNDVARQNRLLIAEAERLRLRLHQTLEELEEVRDQAERKLRESYRRRTADIRPLPEHNSRK